MSQYVRTIKDIDISTQGLLKSIIESGADPDTWDERLRQALNIHRKYLNLQLKQGRKNNNG